MSVQRSSSYVTGRVATRLRNGRNDVATGGGVVVGVTGEGGNGGVKSHNQLTGIYHQDDYIDDNEQGVHLTGALAKLVATITRQRMAEWDKTPIGSKNIGVTDSDLGFVIATLDDYISKTKDDQAEGLIKFLKGAHFGEYVNSMIAGKGAGIDQNGNAQFESVEVRGYMKVMELIINRLSAIQSDYVFADSGNCTAVEDLGQNTYRLTMRKSYDFDFTSLKEDDIVYSIVNNLLTSGEYYTVWMRVLNVNINANTLTVVLFPASECPTGRNFPPIENINIARRGNVSDKTRQSCFYLSSSEGAIVFLDGVTKPILEDHNYQMILGKPKHLKIFDNLPINFDHTYLYVRGLMYQDSFHVRHTGVPVRTEVNRGEWSAQVAASEDPYRYTSTEVHLCWHHGCKWSCYTDKTKEEPKWNATGWVMVEGNNNLSISFVSSAGYAFVHGLVDTNVTPICWLGYIDISDDILPADWEWARDSGLPVEDANWNIAHVTNGRVLRLTNDDMPSNWSVTNKVKFTCSAYVRDGNDVYKVTNTIIA